MVANFNNILITSAGKRVSLVEQFIAVLRSIVPEARVYTTDMNPDMAPACIKSDGYFKVSRVTAPSYINELLDICIRSKIKIVIPTIDTELSVLAANKQLFLDKGINIVVSDISFITLCRDKRFTSDFLLSHDIKVPAPIDKYNPSFPMFAKPYDGSLSQNLHVIRCREELTPEILDDPKLIFMEYIDKSEYKEFTVDLYYGKDNKVKAIVPRERIEIRAGEINKGITRKNYLVSFLKNRLEYLQGVVGCICIQLFYRESDNDVIGIEINPRFGGGYPLSYYAKADYISNIIKEYIFGESLEYSDSWLDNTLMLRYDAEVIVYAE